MSQPGARSRIVLSIIWLLLGAAMVAVPAWLAATRWSPLLHGHPAMLVTAAVCLLLGLVALAWAVASLTVGGRMDRETGDRANPVRRTPRQLRRRARVRIVAAIPAIVVGLLAVAVLAYARPFGATPVATAAMQTEAGVKVLDRLSWYELVPDTRDADGREVKPTTGLVFVPGARVDPRAYAHLLRPLAQAGYLVIVLKDPFGFAVAERDHAQTVIDFHPEVTAWAVGGHSLGGVVAASFADSHPKVKGLLLYASYPASRLSRTDLKVTSVSGEADGLATPDKIAASRAELPADAQFVVVPGAVHSYFGDYGLQPGDGTPTANRAVAQTQITQTTQALLAAITPAPAKRK